MNDAQSILAPNQQAVVAAVQDFVRSHTRSAKLFSQRGCGTTTLLQSLVQYRGFDDCPVEFIYRTVRTTRTPTQSLPCDLDSLQHRVVFLLDRSARHEAVDRLAFQSDRIQWIQAIAPSRLRAVSPCSHWIHLKSLGPGQIRRFIDMQKLTFKGRSIRFSEETIQRLASESGGRLRDLVPMIRDHIKSTATGSKTTSPPFTVQAQPSQPIAPTRRAA